MSETNNKYPIKGTIYEKKMIPVKGTKDPTQIYNKYIITLEVTSSEERNVKDGTKYMTQTEFPQFEAFAPKFDMDSFNIGDFVEIRFFLSRKKFTYKHGDRKGEEGWIQSHPITWMKFADLGSDQPRQSGNKVNVTAMSDTRELEKVFVQPDPEESNEGLDDLPFIISALIGIGSMFII